MNAALLFFFVIVGIPLVELYFLIEVGSEIGALSTILLSVFTAILGGWLVRLQGLSTLLRMRWALERGEVPALELLGGAMLLAAGLLLMFPGFFTDALGFLLLIPAIRRRLVLVVVDKLLVSGGMVAKGPPPGDPPRVIEGEFRRDGD